jgi:hypothetical protein
MGPSNGLCSLCGDLEDCNHIFFTCPLLGFMRAGIRDVLQCDRNPLGADEFLAIAQGLSGPFHRLVWFTFAAQCWALWNIRNKLTIEGKLIGNPADAFFSNVYPYVALEGSGQTEGPCYTGRGDGQSQEVVCVD